jgi:FkbM family methyltransferase
MATLIYRAKKLARTPAIWRGRRTYADERPEVKAKLEQHLYRKKAWDYWICTAIDPHYNYRADLDAESVIVDVGAFRGHVAMELFELYGAHIHSFEPADVFYDDMVRRFDGNERLHAYKFGLGAEDATMSLTVDGQASSFETDATYRNDLETTTVEIRDAATVLDELGFDRIDFMKINIEGGEFALLDRLHESGWLARTRFVLVQFHEWYDRAEVRRWKSRRQLKTHHDEVWSCPWIYELWCHRDDPPSKPAPEAVEAYLQLVRARQAEQAAAADAG